MAAILELLGELDDQDRVLRRQADEYDEADLGENVVILPAQDDAADRCDEAHRHDQDYGERQGEALELRGQNEEDENHRENEREDRGVAGPDLLQRQRRPLEAEPFGQHFGREPLHDLDGLALAVAGSGGAVELGRRIEVVARHPVGSGNVAHRRERAERHGLACRVAHADLEDVLRIVAMRRVRLRDDAERASEQVEVVDVGRADIDLQRRKYVGDVDAEELRLGAVDVEIELRRRRLEQAEHLGQPRRLVRARRHRRRGFL